MNEHGIGDRLGAAWVRWYSSQALARFWLPPVYVLSLAIAVTARGSARYRTGPASTAT